MKKRKVIQVVNYIMLIALIIVFVTGMLLKPMPGMWMGISHGVSGYVVVICAVIHCLQHNMFRRKK